MCTTNSCSCKGESACGCHSHHEHEEENVIKAFLGPIFSFILLIAGILMSHFQVKLFIGNPAFEICWYLVAFLPVGWPVVREAVENITEGDVFNEFFLMAIASIGAFCIGEYAEGVGVMLFYSVGEILQDRAVDRAKGNISRLLDKRSDRARVERDGRLLEVDPKTVRIGETIEVRPGERVPLDGTLQNASGIFDTSSLTGESLPQTIETGGEVLAGMVNTNTVIRIKVSREYGKSVLARILELVDEANENKAPKELFIRRFARVYTPVVMLCAVLMVAVPWVVSLFSSSFNFVFSEWLYRALVFLVISCPCALVISVPLGYFAGIGAASRMGILFKGGSYLDEITGIDTVAFDKTGTLTTGSFTVENIESTGMANETLMALIASAELKSSHPIARALTEYTRTHQIEVSGLENIEEIPGFGVRGEQNGSRVLVGNLQLLKKEGIAYPESLDSAVGTIVACAIDGKYSGYALLADKIKEDAERGVAGLRKEGISHIVMLSGDKKEIVEAYARRLGIEESHGGMLPTDKAGFIKKLSALEGRRVAFIGDGMNDAPVLASSDLGVAMGGLGSDAAIESADVVIQTDMPSRMATAIRIGKTTRAIVMENIVGAIAIKLAILILGSLGIASLWAAVFADVGVALLAVLNSMRIMWKHY